MEYDEKEPKKAPQKAISLFRKRWWKKHKTPLKHWLITELGHDNTKRIHLHGIIWTELTEEQFEKEWGYGWIFFGYEISEKTINSFVLINSLFSRHPNIYINPECRHLIKDLEMVQVLEDYQIDKKDKELSHLLDCLRYYLETYFMSFLKIRFLNNI